MPGKESTSNNCLLSIKKTKHRCKKYIKSCLRKTWHVVVVPQYWLPPSCDQRCTFCSELTSPPCPTEPCHGACDIVLLFISLSLPDPAWAVSRFSPNPRGVEECVKTGKGSGGSPPLDQFPPFGPGLQTGPLPMANM